jgi:hypothetical protein
MTGNGGFFFRMLNMTTFIFRILVLINFIAKDNSIYFILQQEMIK